MFSETGGEGQGGDAAEQTGTYTLTEMYDHVVNGMRLIIVYNKTENAFTGTLENVTDAVIPQARVEIHQSNGIELGPTDPVDLIPGQRINVRLNAEGTFGSWAAHPERGGGEGSEGSGEHGSEDSGESHGKETFGSWSTHPERGGGEGSEGSGEHGSEGFGESQGKGTFDSWSAHPERGGGEGSEGFGEHGSEGSGESHGSGDRG